VTDLTDEERKMFMEFIIENLKPSSMLHKDTRRVFEQMWREHRSTEAKLNERKFPYASEQKRQKD
jgi:hypothetical protein